MLRTSLFFITAVAFAQGQLRAGTMPALMPYYADAFTI
jgi:hypothetical protein